MASPSVLSARASVAGAHHTPLTAAILAADVAAAEGFRVVDVRFYFLLFTNWMEDDLLRPGLDLDLTQVRRVLARLVEAKQASVETGRRPAYRLTAGGVLALVDTLTDPLVPRSFEEVILLVTIAASYRGVLAERVHGAARSPGRRILARLDPVSILAQERTRLQRALHDLEERIAGGLEMAQLVADQPGDSPTRQAERLEGRRRSYQLQPVRGLAEIVGSLPPGLAAFELAEGLAFRSRAMFTPLAEQLRARLSILDRLEGVVRG